MAAAAMFDFEWYSIDLQLSVMVPSVIYKFQLDRMYSFGAIAIGLGVWLNNLNLKKTFKIFSSQLQGQN